MKKCFCLILVILLVLSGCTFAEVETEYKDEESATSMFVLIEEGAIWRIVYHKDTKVLYSVSHYGSFTLLVNPDGTPMIWGGWHED